MTMPSAQEDYAEMLYETAELDEVLKDLGYHATLVKDRGSFHFEQALYAQRMRRIDQLLDRLLVLRPELRK